MYHILVVDDEARIRSIIKKYAEFEGHTVTEAGDGLEAVRLCRKEKYDIIIMDIMMPELDGFSACREIRKVAETPIIMLSARGEEYDKINGFELGIDDYAVKPFSPKELMLRVEAIMKRIVLHFFGTVFFGFFRLYFLRISCRLLGSISLDLYTSAYQVAFALL